MPLRFGEFELDRERRQLLRSGEPVPLEPKAYELLVLLVERRPKALSRAQIRDVVWPGTFISESTLGVTVNAIRQALGDDARRPRFIRTVHGFGYAFCGEVAGDTVDEGSREKARAADPRRPYPGLSPFTEADAEVFFGREAEVEALWERLQRRRLLALIGPSGAGKTSFLQAGVIPARPEGWGAIVSTPGRSPMTGLAQALAPEVAGDAEAVKELLRFDDPDVAVGLLGRWRHGVHEALLVVDQLEEVFTLNPAETQERFAEMVGRLVDEADIHVLLSLRDDFLMRCDGHDALRPVFGELTPLSPLPRDGLRRALTEPARKEGFSFEDVALVEEMLESVEGVRGTLPLLAFAVARLWEKRDRDRKLLTRAVYEEIGGVAGALAQHAEQTLEKIGPQRDQTVRELFRNLVTAQQTRAAADREELLSVLPDREAGAHVLDQLIDARLLTSYEERESVRRSEPVNGGDRGKDLADDSYGAASARPSHRIEIVHESLLHAWPRLVRWQAQDEEGAVLRDQLKQAAHLWEEKGRTPDLLWSGTAFREYELWRERYPGKLTALEEDFSGSMVERARRRRRIRRGAVAAAFLVLAGVAGAIAVSRQQTARARDEARAQARRAEASKLLALAQARLEDDPTEALALTTASLDVADTREARVFAMKALWTAPPALELDGGGSAPRWPSFNPDGQWLAAAGNTENVGVWAETGERVALLGGHRISPHDGNLARWASGRVLVTGLDGGADTAQVWSFPSGERIREFEFGGPSSWGLQGEHLVAETLEDATAPMQKTLRLRSWRLPDGEAQELGRVDLTALGVSSSCFEPNGTGWLYTKGRTIYFRPLPADGRGDRVVSRHDSPVRVLLTRPHRVVFAEESGRSHICCSLSDGRPVLTESFPEVVIPEDNGRWLVNDTSAEPMARLWSRTTWPGARPLTLRRNASWYVANPGFHPTGDWLVVSTGNLSKLTFWPLDRAYPTVVDGYSSIIRPLVFSPDSRSLVTSWSADENRLRLWPVGERMWEGPGVLELPERGLWTDARFEPSGRYLFVVGNSDRAYVVPLDGSPARRLEGFSEGNLLVAAAVSPSGRRVATGFFFGDGEKTLRVWDLDTGELRLFDLPDGASAPPAGGEPASGQTGYDRGVVTLAFADESTLYSGGDGGIRRWNLDDGTHELVLAEQPGYILMVRFDGERRTALMRRRSSSLLGECHPVQFVDLRAGAVRLLPSFGECVERNALALDASGTVAATGAADGLIRVGRLSGGEPHLLFGHEAAVQFVAISPDLRWVASSGEDNTLRLWPMPDLDQPPLYTLPHDELLAKLRSLTNIRAVRDPEAPNGWAIKLDPFPGWKDAPTW